MRRKCERRRGNINADAAGAEVFAGDGCSQGASFGPMAAISQRWRGGRIYNNTRTRERLRRKCVKPRRPHNPFPAEDLLPPPHNDAPCPSIFSLPSRALPLPHAAPTHTRRLRHAFPAEDLRSPPLFRFGHKKTAPHSGCAMHSPPTSRHIPRRRPSLAPDSDTPCPSIFSLPARALPLPLPAPMHSSPKVFARPAQRRALPLPSCHIPAAQTHARRLRHAFLAALTTHSPPKAVARPRSATLPPLPFRAGHKKTAPHSGCAMPNVSVDRRCGRSFGLVSRALFAAVAGRWRGGVGLRPQPWALRSRRCGRVLRA